MPHLSSKLGRGYPVDATNLCFRHAAAYMVGRKSRTHHRAARAFEAGTEDDADWQERLESGGATAALFFAAAALGFGALAFAADTGLLVKSPLLHLLEHSLFGELALEHPHRLIERAFNPDFHRPPYNPPNKTLELKSATGGVSTTVGRIASVRPCVRSPATVRLRPCARVGAARTDMCKASAALLDDTPNAAKPARAVPLAGPGQEGG